MREKVAGAILGMLIRGYRRTPLHPRLGRRLAWILGAIVSRRPSVPVLKQVDGIQFELHLEEVIDSSLYFSGTFEPATERVIDQRLEPGDVAVDVGANIGYHTLRMSRRVGSSGHVLAIEPMSSAFDRLRRNGTLNSVENVTYLQVALGRDDQGMTPVDFRSSYRLDGRDIRETSTVEVVTLDTVAQRLDLDRVDFVKIDVDGLELRVLQGARGMLSRFSPSIVLEVTPTAMIEMGDDPDDVARILTDLGYRFSTEEGQPIRRLPDFLRDLPAGISANIVATK